MLHIHTDESGRNLIPRQFVGGKINIRLIADMPFRKTAIELFTEIKYRLMHVNRWADLCNGKCAGAFTLTNEYGGPKTTYPETGDHIRICTDLYSAANPSYDWVKIECIDILNDSDRDIENYGIRVAQCEAPFLDDTSVADFFITAATTTFLAARNKNEVCVGIYGRNEKDLSGPGNAIYFSEENKEPEISFAGLSEQQWELLANGFMFNKLVHF